MRMLCSSFIFAAILASTCFSAQPSQVSANSESPLLPWTTDYEKALASAKAQSLPIYLFFTGSTWCIWCQRMEKDIHSQDTFRQKTVGKFIFVKIDLPAGSQPDDATKKLLSTYNIRGVPAIIILSPEGQELGRFRYQQIPAGQYADLVLQAASKSS